MPMQKHTSVLIVDDDEAHAEAAAEALERIGMQCGVATSGEQGLEKMQQDDVDIVITDLRMADVDGMEILEAARRERTDIEVIMVTGHGSERVAVEAMQRGAYSYLPKPYDMNELRAVVQKAAEKQRLVRSNLELRRQLDKKYGFAGIIGNSAPMQRIFDVLGQISVTNATVLIQGESGTGKELIARALHNNSPRKARSFVGLNCAALSEGILESELFGHEKGAFTGADHQRQGRFEYADHGTLFLDEVGDMPISTQIKLLRVIEEREIMRVGSNVPIQVDVRLIAATNQDIEQLVAERKFRQDLYFRLNVVRMDLPPLRERRGDVPLLIDAFIKEFSALHNKAVAGMTPDARAALGRYHWPGNIRELKNCIESMTVVARDEMLTLQDVPSHIRAGYTAEEHLAGAQADGSTVAESVWASLAGLSLDAVEKELIRHTLAKVDGSREEAARMLGMGERTLYRKLDKYQLK